MTLDLDKMKKLLLFLLCLLLVGPAIAGGSSFQMRITSFRATGDDQYIMKIEQMSDSYINALSILEEYDGKKVVYSFANPI